MAWDAEAAAISRAEAKNELALMLEELTPEERAGIEKIGKWWRKWFNGHNGRHATGHGSLAQMLYTNRDAFVR